MKVLIIATWYPSHRDPVAGVFVRDQVRALATRHDVAVVAPHHLSLWPGITIGQEDGATVVRPRFLIPPIRWFGWNRVSSLLYRRAVMKAYQVLVRDWGRPDVIHAHVAFPGGWCAATIGHSESIPVVITEHTGRFTRFLTPAFRRDGTRWALQHAVATVAVSKGLSDEIREAIGVEPIVVANAFDTDFFVPAPRLGPQKPVRLLTVGMLRRVKGVDVLLDALHMLPPGHRSDWELVVGGDGPERRSLITRAHRLGIADQVRFAGRLDRSEVRDLMQWTDFFVLASRWENLPGVVIESLLCDRPVIATRCGGPEHMLTPEVGLLVPPEDPAALSEAILAALRGELRPTPGAARELAVSRYGTERFLNEIGEIYQAARGRPRT